MCATSVLAKDAQLAPLFAAIAAPRNEFHRIATP
jgi:hypothetical protein